MPVESSGAMCFVFIHLRPKRRQCIYLNSYRQMGNSILLVYIGQPRQTIALQQAMISACNKRRLFGTTSLLCGISSDVFQLTNARNGMQSLSDKTVLITGAAGGFGQSMVWQFLREGCKIILSDLDEAKLRAATRETLDRHELPLGEAILGYIAADLSSSAGCDALYTMCQQITPSI